MLLFAPIDVLNDLLLRLGLGEETIRYFVWPLIQIGLVVTLVALWVAYATYLERKISAFMQARLGRSLGRAKVAPVCRLRRHGFRHTRRRKR